MAKDRSVVLFQPMTIVRDSLPWVLWRVVTNLPELGTEGRTWRGKK